MTDTPRARAAGGSMYRADREHAGPNDDVNGNGRIEVADVARLFNPLRLLLHSRLRSHPGRGTSRAPSGRGSSGTPISRIFARALRLIEMHKQ
ncbi:MAG: hypothetical protein ABFC89_07730 [Methanospirillum sp.]